MKKDLEIKTKELRKHGYSVKELQAMIGVSTSTISRWIQNVPLSAEAQKRLIDRSTKARIKAELTIREQTRQKNITAENFAAKILSNEISKDFLGVLCSMIYHCEGSKQIQKLTFTNSDPSLIKTFLFLLRNSFDINEAKLRVLMHLHDYHNEEEQKIFWSQVTGIPAEQFNKTYQKPSDHRYKKEGYKGCINLSYCDVSIARKLHFIAKKFMERYN